MRVTIEEIRNRLHLTLPGEDAHVPVSPSGRARSSESFKNAFNYKESAVGLILYEDKDDLNVVLTQRPIYDGFHGGQVCFPGGKKDYSDKELLETAIREAEEEIGLNANNFDLLGHLTPVFIPVSNHNVQPFVLHYKQPPLFIPNEREVAEIFTFPVQELFKNDIIKRIDITMQNNVTLKDVPYFNIHEKIVWGATAMILNEFRWLINKEL